MNEYCKNWTYLLFLCIQHIIFRLLYEDSSYWILGSFLFSVTHSIPLGKVINSCWLTGSMNWSTNLLQLMEDLTCFKRGYRDESGYIHILFLRDSAYLKQDELNTIQCKSTGDVLASRRKLTMTSGKGSSLNSTGRNQPAK